MTPTKRKRPSGNPATRQWQPMEKGTLNPDLNEFRETAGGTPAHEAWMNDIYQCVVTHAPCYTHLSIKRHDRAAVRDWRHLQQIKNEVCGPEREAIELFPAESRLTDTANEYHLWVLPEGVRVGMGFNEERFLMTPEQIADFNKAMGGGKARQRAWQPGLTTGLGERLDEPDDDRR